MKASRFVSAIIGVGLVVGTSEVAKAHCDGLDGPVVSDAQRALESNDVSKVLRWVRPSDEGVIRKTFKHAQSVRALGNDAKKLADRFFFETLVRVHRAGEGAPYTGLKPAGRDLGPALPAADRAVVSGSSKELNQLLTHAAREGVAKRLAAVRTLRPTAERDVASGRKYVAAYVEFVHYVEGIHGALKPSTPHGESTAEHGGHHDAD